jgi:hypothetical protein
MTFRAVAAPIDAARHRQMLKARDRSLTKEMGHEEQEIGSK